jgi:nicotinamidase/pyrazinamidase
MRIDPETDALVVVDLQPDFMPGGALAVAGGDEVAAPIGRLARRFRTVVATQDWHPRGHVSFASSHGHQPFATVELDSQRGTQRLWPDHCVAGTPGAALHPALPDELITLILRKGTRKDVDSYSAFRENRGPDGTRPRTGLAAWLEERGLKRLFLCGLARDVCVADTAVDATALGFAVYVIDDLTRAVDPGSRANVNAHFAAHDVTLIDSKVLL